MNEMTVAELIEQLEQMNPEAKVRLATQPTYPFEYTINKVVETQDGTCYIAQGEQLGYLADQPREDIGWGTGWDR
ncbi:hypothetical protein ACF1AE_21885 [Streptomyces sp. NPDC014986]|uniref:hypothetical protein n=1 Tax=Streptomyces sp. NPDC014986 TaxID=3364934 RepID=UPI0036F67CD0